MLRPSILYPVAWLLLTAGLCGAQGVADWLPQINFRPSPALQAAVMNRPAIAEKGIWHFQKMEAGTGALYTDCFAFTVMKPPRVAGRDMTQTELLHWSRSHLNDFLPQEMASCRVEGFEDQWRWESSVSAAGAVVEFGLKTAEPPGVACMAVAEQNSAYWALCSVHASAQGMRDWPVSGNRWFGISENAQAEPDEPAVKKKEKGAPEARPAAKKQYTFYTRGAWRLQSGTGPEQAGAIIKREEELWKGFSAKLQAFITENGGECAPGTVPSGQWQHDWDQVRGTIFSPRVSWADPEGTWVSQESKERPRFRLEVQPGLRTCEFIETGSGGRELRRTVPMQPAGDQQGWRIERSSVDPEVLEFQGFDAASREQIIAAAPGPCYLVFTRKGGVINARWHGFIVSRDGNGGIAAIKAPGATKPKDYVLAPAKQE